MTVEVVTDRNVSIALACRTLFSINESCYRYERKLGDENAEWLAKLTSNRRA